MRGNVCALLYPDMLRISSCISLPALVILEYAYLLISK